MNLGYLVIGSMALHHFFLIEFMKHPPTVSYYNTYFLVNTDKYEIPSGFISSCLYSMSWPGLMLFSLSYGWLGRFIQQVTYNHSHEIHWMQYIYVYSALIWSDYTIYADPKNIATNTFFGSLFHAFFLIVLSSKLIISDKYLTIKNEAR
ncbi:hypothetical protein [Acaryochloris sp. 'Moss Beach']|uniref:hypothetical protein n=1 Tax=Acaryochloris sp. 'Moss Beach' TaxID=2740837 RepID=UPI001F3EAD51|nr:hypothetical protein [Acaryochloris sp. 'Moss Beach']